MVLFHILLPLLIPPIFLFLCLWLCLLIQFVFFCSFSRFCFISSEAAELQLRSQTELSVEFILFYSNWFIKHESLKLHFSTWTLMKSLLFQSVFKNYFPWFPGNWSKCVWWIVFLLHSFKCLFTWNRFQNNVYNYIIIIIHNYKCFLLMLWGFKYHQRLFYNARGENTRLYKHVLCFCLKTVKCKDIFNLQYIYNKYQNQQLISRTECTFFLELLKNKLITNSASFYFILFAENIICWCGKLVKTKLITFILG